MALLIRPLPFKSKRSFLSLIAVPPANRTRQQKDRKPGSFWPNSSAASAGSIQVSAPTIPDCIPSAIEYILVIDVLPLNEVTYDLEQFLALDLRRFLVDPVTELPLIPGSLTSCANSTALAGQRAPRPP